MNYQIDILPQALGEIEAAFRWQADFLGSAAAEAWYDALMAGIRSLETFPNRCPVAPESKEFQQQIRQLWIGKDRRYRVLFVVEQSQVSVLYVRHTSQAWLTRSIDDEDSPC